MIKIVDLDRARRSMEKYGIDALVASSVDNFGYLSGYWAYRGKDYDIGWIGDPLLQIAVVPLDKNTEPFILTVDYPAEVDYVDPWIKDRRYYKPAGYGVKDEGSFFDVFGKIIREKGLDRSRIGLELGYEGFTTAIDASLVIKEKAKDLLPNAKIVDSSNLLREMRLIKTEEEISRIKISHNIVQRAIKASFEEIREGMTKLDLDWIIRANLVKDRVNVALTVLNFGENDMLRPNEKKLQKGDFIRIDLACPTQHYYGDLSRSMIFGKPSARLQNMYDAARKTHDKIVGSIKLGVKFSELFDITKKLLKDAGYEYTSPHVGHGIGICVHEAPYLGGNNMTVQPGMTFTVELMLKVGPGSWVGLEDDIICDSKGCHDITTLSKEFTSL